MFAIESNGALIARFPISGFIRGEEVALSQLHATHVVAELVTQLPLVYAVHARSGGPDLDHRTFGCKAASRQSQCEEYTPQVRLADEDSDEGKEAAERAKCERLPPFTAGICSGGVRIGRKLRDGERTAFVETLPFVHRDFTGLLNRLSVG